MGEMAPGSFYVNVEKDTLLARHTFLPDDVGVTPHDVAADEPEAQCLDDRIDQFLRRHANDTVHPCHWLIFSILASVFTFSILCTALTLHEFRVRQPPCFHLRSLRASVSHQGAGGRRLCAQKACDRRPEAAALICSLSTAASGRNSQRAQGRPGERHIRRPAFSLVQRRRRQRLRGHHGRLSASAARSQRFMAVRVRQPAALLLPLARLGVGHRIRGAARERRVFRAAPQSSVRPSPESVPQTGKGRLVVPCMQSFWLGTGACSQCAYEITCRYLS